MYNNGQWSGHGQKEMADSLEVLVKITPQLPIDNLVYHARILRKKVIKYLAHYCAICDASVDLFFSG